MGRGNRNKRSKKSNNAAPAPKKKKKEYTKAQKLAQKRIAAKKESTKTTSGKTTSTSAQVAKDNKKYGNTVPSGSFGISQAGKDKAAINRGIAAAKKTGIPSGKNLKSGSFGISQAGKKQAAINRASVKKSSGPKFQEDTKIATHDNKLFKSVPATGPAADVLAGPEFKRLHNVEGDLIKGGDLFNKNNSLGIPLASNPLGLAFNAITGTQEAAAQPMNTRPKLLANLPSDYKQQEQALSAASGLNISGGGLNIGSDTATTDSKQSTSRALDPTESGLSIQEKARRRDAIFRETGVQTYGGTRDVYGYSKSELDKLRNFSDKSGLSFGSVIGQRGTNYPGQLGVSEEEIALNNAYNFREDGLVMNSIGQLVTPEQRAIDDADAGPSVGRSLATGFNNIVDRIPVIGKRLPDLKTDYTRAEQNLLTKTTPFKTGSRTKTGAVNRRGGGARLPVAPMTPEEILEEAAVGQTVPDYQQAPIAQTGVDPNRLMQIQQDAYLQAYNPTYNPMFRFFDRRRGARRGAFRKAFRRD